MCTVVVARRPLPGVALAVAACRDELYSRPRAGFTVASSNPLALGGLDPEAGGAWLVISTAGFLAGVTNAKPGARRSPHQPSRGLMVRKLAGCSNPDKAHCLLQQADLSRFPPANFFVADPEKITYACNWPTVTLRILPGNWLDLGNAPLGRSPRSAFVKERLKTLLSQKHNWLEASTTALASHGALGACRHSLRGGTVEAMVAVLEEQGAWLGNWWPGPPCSTHPRGFALARA